MRKMCLRFALSLSVVLTLSYEAGHADASFWPLAEKEVERGLSNKNIQVRRSAARKLAELSPSVARRALEQALNDEDREVRLIALRTARAFDQGGLAPQAYESLKSRDVAERVHALRLVALEPTEESVELLESMLADADPLVRRETALALGNVPEAYAARVSGKLLGMLDDSVPAVRLEVASALGRLGQPSAVLALAGRLNDPEPEVRVQVALALGATGVDTAIPALQVALLDPHDAVVTAVVTTLGSFDSEDVIVGLVSIAEKFPQRPQGQAAVEALVRLSKFPGARRHVIGFFESPLHRTELHRVFHRSPPEAVSLLTECVRTFSSAIALECAHALARRNAGTTSIIEAEEQGRLSPSQVLEVLQGVPERATIVLSLERLSLGDPGEFRAALRYLESLEELPKEAEAPIVDALTSKGRTAADVASLAHVLGTVQGSPSPSVLRGLLASSDDAVRYASAWALVRRGSAGAQLRELLMGEERIAAGALAGLSISMTALQAETLLRLTEEGRSGRRSAYLSAFFAMPEDLSDDTWRRLFGLYESARGAERDALLYPLVRAGGPELQKKLLASASRADKLKIAQLTWYQPRALPLGRRLLSDSIPEVAALAAFSVGRNGTSVDAKSLEKKALSSAPHVVRAAAVQGLIFLIERGLKPKLNDSLFSRDSCESPHDAFRAQMTRLAAVLGRTCAGRSIEDVLLRARDPRQRLLAAEVIRRQAPESRALRRCRFYESRVEVAELCSVSAAPAPERPRAGLPYRMHQVRASQRVLPLSPFSVRVPGSALDASQEAVFSLRLVTDRAGQVAVPVEAKESIDPDWFF